MNPTLDQAFSTKYPKILSSLRYGAFKCGNGWYDLIDTLCRCIQAYIDYNPTMIKQVVAGQVKGKFGGLRFYVTGGDTHTDGMITLAESMSFHICDVCADKGYCKSNENGWISTRCKEHQPKESNHAS